MNKNEPLIIVDVVLVTSQLTFTENQFAAPQDDIFQHQSNHHDCVFFCQTNKMKRRKNTLVRNRESGVCAL